MFKLAALATLLGASAPANLPAASSAPGLAVASASLDGRTQCVRFNWIANEGGAARGAIAVPATINGRVLSLQLDTGADVTSVYGRLAEQAGWARAGSESFTAGAFMVAGTGVERPAIYVNTGMEADAAVQGTLGLPAMLGKVAVLDYPGRRFCLFAPADVPAPIAQAPSVRAMLRNSKLYVPVSAGRFSSDTMVFDTGSSELPLNVDLTTWRRLTGRAGTDNAPASYRGSAWGKPLVIPGAPSASPVSIGRFDLGRIIVFTNPLQPAGFADWPVPTDGVLGNAPLWDGIVVLDLTARVRFGVIR